jgi:hypothetical protein
MSLIKQYKLSLPYRYQLLVDAGLDGEILRASVAMQSMMYGYFAPKEERPHVWAFGVQDGGAYPDGVPSSVMNSAVKVLLDLLGDGHAIEVPELQQSV